MGWAKSARSDRERGIFMQMAATWLHAAALAQGRESSHDPGERQQPTVAKSA